MNILFLTYDNLEQLPGIAKKILSQKEAMQNLGNKVFLSHITQSDGLKKLQIDDEVIVQYKPDIISRVKYKFSHKSILEWVKINSIDVIYVRYTKYADPFFVKLFKEFKKVGIVIFFEIPTYPYDNEQKCTTFKSKIYQLIEKICRVHLVRYVDRIVTFSDDDYIWNVKTIKIINGVNPNLLPLKQNKKTSNLLNLLGVASLNFWHGYDRIIEGLNLYYKNSNYTTDVYFHIVGDEESNDEYKRLSSLVKKYGLEKYVIFHGRKIGKELDEIFNSCDIGIGSLGRHRSNVFKFQSLKNIEYAIRGIPFIYSEISDLFDGESYVLRCSPDDSPISINSLLEFYKRLNNTPLDIRLNCLRKGIDWESQFKKIIINEKIYL